MTSAEASRHVNPKMFFVKDVAMPAISQIIDLDCAPSINQPETARISTKRQRVIIPCLMTGFDEGVYNLEFRIHSPFQKRNNY
jgi:hypothetical protein